MQKIKVKPKQEVWWKKKLREKDAEIARLREASPLHNGNTFSINSYTQGFYDCMSKYAIFAKAARRRIISTIKERYKGNGDMNYVRKVK